MSVPLIGPDGKAYEVDEANVEKAKAAGYRVDDGSGQTLGESLSEVAADARPVHAAVGLGAAEGITGGGYGAYVGKTQPAEVKQAVNEAREESPIAHTVGELGGMLLSPLNAPGSAVTKAIGATSRLGRIGANMAGGATTGVLFGAGKTVSDAALGDVELTAQKLLAGAGLGAVLGLAGGGVGGLIEEGARALLPSLRTLAGRAGGALDEIANDSTITATKATQNVINRLGDEKVLAAAKALREGGHLEGKLLSSADDILKSVEQRIGKVGAEKSAILDVAEAGGAKPLYSELGKRLDDFEAGLNPLQRKIINKELTDLREGLAEIGARPVTAGGGQGSGFRALDDLRQTVAKRAKFSKGAAGVDDEALQLKRALAGTFRDEIDRQLVPQLGSDIGKHWGDTKALYGALKDAASLAKSGAGRANTVGLKDLAWGIATAGATGHPLGIAGALGAKVLREHGPVLIARIADRLAKEPALSAVAASFAAALPTTAPKLGQFGAVLAQEARVSPMRALAAHVAYAQLDPSYAATAQLAGLTPEAPDEHAATLGRAQALADARAAAQAHDRAISEALDGVVKGKAPAASSVLKSQDFGAKRMRQDSIEAHRRRVDEVRQLASDPQALLDRVSKNLLELGTVAPAVSASMTAAAERAVKYLAQAAEVPPKPGPLAREWTPTAAERHTFALKLEAVQQPMSILQHAARGSLVRQQVDAVRAVYPSFAKAVEEQALERLVSGEPIPYRARLMLSVLTGVDPDGTLSGRSIAMNQQAISNAQGKPSERMPAQQQDVKLGQADRMALPGEKRQLGMEEA